MSELIHDNADGANLRWALLASASALALTSYITSTNLANAEDADRPTVWIELGGQLEHVARIDKPFAAGFYDQIDPSLAAPTATQNALPLAAGPEGKISVQPEESDWIFSVGVRYGRASNDRLTQEQTKPGNYYDVSKYNGPGIFGGKKCCQTHATVPDHVNFADIQSRHQESDLVLDFQAGKDVGLGLLGRNGSSVINAGVRFAQFTAKSTVTVKANADLQHYNQFTVFPSFALFHHYYPQKYQLGSRFRAYSAAAASARSFRGVGPAVSWDASATLLGNPESSELTFDWGVNAALLFGKQKAQTQHQSSGIYYSRIKFGPGHNSPLYTHPLKHYTRSRSVTVPNVGAMAGFSVKFPNAKVSMGYQADFFFGAVDTGWDERQTSNTAFRGPYATISIGLGG